MSPPVSPVAKSDQTPVTVLILNEPGLLSDLVGLVAIHSFPTSLPCGSHREASIGAAGIEAAFTATKFTLGLPPEKAVSDAGRWGSVWLAACHYAPKQVAAA
jgi:hypothetical protein